MIRLRVLIVDDSAFSRRILRDVLSKAGFEVIGLARDGKQGLQLALELRPDVITMDIDMPEMDGLTALKAIMEHCPTPVVMVSARTQDAAPATLACLEAGAVDAIGKLSGSHGLDLRDQELELVEKVRVAASARLGNQRPPTFPLTPPVSPPPSTHTGRQRVVALGASTGGPRNVAEMLARLPANLAAPVLYVQHMPAQFTTGYAQRLNALGPLPCKEVEDDEELLPGRIYLAPGDRHLTVKPPIRVGLPYRLRLSLEPSTTLFRPSVDVMMTSVARLFGPSALGVIMTGMGRDGADGMKAIKLAGGTTIAEAEETAVINGMPGVVVQAGLAHYVAPHYRIAELIAREVKA